MNNKITEALRLLCKDGTFEIERISMADNDTYHTIRHSFKPEVLIPVAAMSNTPDFFLGSGVKHIKTADGVECVVKKWNEFNILDAEEDVKSLYGMGVWDFLSKWHKNEPFMTSLLFLRLYLVRDENRDNR